MAITPPRNSGTEPLTKQMGSLSRRAQNQGVIKCLRVLMLVSEFSKSILLKSPPFLCSVLDTLLVPGTVLRGMHTVQVVYGVLHVHILGDYYRYCTCYAIKNSSRVLVTVRAYSKEGVEQCTYGSTVVQMKYYETQICSHARESQLEIYGAQGN
jgi:hypothetical protein